MGKSTLERKSYQRIMKKKYDWRKWKIQPMEKNMAKSLPGEIASKIRVPAADRGRIMKG